MRGKADNEEAAMEWTKFLDMGKYAPYVWGSYGMALAIFIMEIVLVRHKRKLTLKRLRMMRDAGVEE